MHDQYLKPGTTLQGGKYRIERVLGQGGFGITYKALMKDMVSGRLGTMEIEVPVAIKEFFMKDNCVRDEESSHVSIPSVGMRNSVEQFRSKFVKEANNLSHLNHPNIVQVIDVFSENGTDYYVMEYLEGGSLRDIVKRDGQIDEATALQYIYKVGDALDYMHNHKHMCHYDVKPGNILLDKNGSPKLIDFGISKNYDSEGNQTSSTPVGLSAGFAPLEQYQQSVSEFSPQTDVYALGATLYYLLTGNVPPEASKVFNEGLPSLPDTIFLSTRKAIEQAMQPRKKDRPRSVDAFLNVLTDITTKVVYDNGCFQTKPAKRNEPNIDLDKTLIYNDASFSSDNSEKVESVINYLDNNEIPPQSNKPSEFDNLLTGINRGGCDIGCLIVVIVLVLIVVLLYLLV